MYTPTHANKYTYAHSYELSARIIFPYHCNGTINNKGLSSKDQYDKQFIIRKHNFNELRFCKFTFVMYEK